MASFLGPILVFGVVDAFTYSYPFQAFWKNDWVNVVEGKSSFYETSPWYGYLSPIVKNWLLAFLPIGLLVILDARRSPILAWIAVVILLSHGAIAHKEYRFIYPAILMAIVLARIGTTELIARWQSLWFSRRGAIAAVTICLLFGLPYLPSWRLDLVHSIQIASPYFGLPLR